MLVFPVSRKRKNLVKETLINDVPESIAHTICLWLAAHRRAHDARPWQRAATCRVQAVLLLRWMVAGTALTTLARDSKVSRATA